MRKREKTPMELGQERWKARMAAQQMFSAESVQGRAEASFYEALGLTKGAAEMVASFDKKQILDKLLPAWVALVAAFERVAEDQRNAAAQVAEAVEGRCNVMAQQVIRSVAEINKAFADARDLSWFQGRGAALSEQNENNALAGMGIDPGSRVAKPLEKVPGEQRRVT